MPYQLCLSDEPLSRVMDDMAADANAVAPGLGRDRARALIEQLFAARVTQSTACGMYPACRPVQAVWPGFETPRSADQAPCAFHDPEPHELPNVFALLAADLVDCGWERDALEERLASVFRAGLARVLFHNPRCGRAAVCQAPPTDPFRVR